MTNTIHDVFYELLDVLEGYCYGLPVSRLHYLERGYMSRFYKSLDYESLGVSDIQELIGKMGGMVLWFEERERKENHVISADIVELRRKLLLKPDVKKLLNTHHGEIEFNSFEDSYKDKFKMDLDYDLCALTDLDHLCEVFKDNLVVEVANPSGEKVVKAVNLDKRKRIEEEYFSLFSQEW